MSRGPVCPRVQCRPKGGSGPAHRPAGCLCQRTELGRGQGRLRDRVSPAQAPARAVRPQAHDDRGRTPGPADALWRRVEAALAAQGRRSVVVEPGEVTDDLVQDMIEVLTSFCARLYGRWSARNKAKKALEAIEREG